MIVWKWFFLALTTVVVGGMIIPLSFAGKADLLSRLNMLLLGCCLIAIVVLVLFFSPKLAFVVYAILCVNVALLIFQAFQAKKHR